MSAPSRFHGRLTLALLGESCGRSVWRVESSISYWSPVLYAGYEYGDLLTIPVGFVTDLASAPRYVPFAWMLAGGVANGPAVIHDYLYALKWPTQALADAAFYEAMGISQPDLGFVQVPQPKRWVMHSMVHLFGGSAWADLTSVSRRSLGLPAELPP